MRTVLLQCSSLICVPGVLIAWAMSAFTHFYNKRLPGESEEKRNYHPYAWLAVPFTWPILLPLYALTAVLSAILYALFFAVLMVVFTLALLFVRKPFLFKWLKETSLKVGRFFLKINTWLLNLFLPVSASASSV